MKFARLNPDLTFLDIILMEQSAYNDLLISNPAEAALLRPLVVDPLPTPSSLEKVVEGPVVIEATQARQTWILVPKTPEDLEADLIAAELDQLNNRIDNLVVAINDYQARLDIPYVEPARDGNNATEIDNLRVRVRAIERNERDLYRDLILTMRSARWLLRRARAEF
jgi:hypothetical protein